MYNKIMLNNGLKIVSKPIPGVNSVALGVWINVGSRFETKRISGISHFLEHMVFKGTHTRSADDIKRSIEGIGGTLNGFTGEECTCYWVKVVGKHQRAALEVLADMVVDPKIDARDIEKERIVILEEIKMYKDLPNHYVHELLEEILWPEHPLSRSIAGSVESVSSIDRKDLLAFKKKSYHPGNVTIVAVGNVDREDIADAAKSLFAATGPDKKISYERVRLGKKFQQCKFHCKDTEQTHLAMGLYGLPKFHPQRYSLALANIILGANMSSRLFNEVREKRGLAYEIVSHLKEYQDAGLVTVSAGVDNRKVTQALRVILREIAKMKKQCVKAGELARAKEFFRGQFMMMLEETLNHMVWLGDKVIYRKDLPDPETIISQMDRVTVGDIKTLANQLFKKDHLKIAFIGPLKDRVQKQVTEIANSL